MRTAELIHFRVAVSMGVILAIVFAAQVASTSGAGADPHVGSHGNAIIHVWAVSTVRAIEPEGAKELGWSRLAAGAPESDAATIKSCVARKANVRERVPAAVDAAPERDTSWVYSEFIPAPGGSAKSGLAKAL